MSPQELRVRKVSNMLRRGGRRLDASGKWRHNDSTPVENLPEGVRLQPKFTGFNSDAGAVLVFNVRHPPGQDAMAFQLILKTGKSHAVAGSRFADLVVEAAINSGMGES